jgi:hypothetical protein
VLTDLARVTLAFLLLAALGLIVMPVRIPSPLRRCGIGLAVVQALVTMDVARDDPGVTTAGAHHQVSEGLANHVVPSLAAGLLAWILILVGQAWRAAARELRAAPQRRR